MCGCQVSGTLANYRSARESITHGPSRYNEFAIPIASTLCQSSNDTSSNQRELNCLVVGVSLTTKEFWRR